MKVLPKGGELKRKREGERERERELLCLFSVEELLIRMVESSLTRIHHPVITPAPSG